MTEFSRLLDSSSNQEVLALLESGLSDAPPADALPKAATAIGVAAASLPAVGAAQGAIAKGSAMAKSSALATKAGTVAGSSGALAGGAASAGAVTTGVLGTGSSLAMLGKTLIVSMLSAGVATAGAIAVSESYFAGAGSVEATSTRAPTPKANGERPTTSPPHQQPSAAEGSVRSNDETTLSAPAATPDPARVPGATAEPTAQAATGDRVSATASKSARAVAPRTGSAPGNLSREVRQIDSARTALESKNASGALAELETYESTQRSGALDREALLLRIEALVQQQNYPGATALARDYLRRFPNDAHAPRLRALVSAHSTHVGSFPAE